MISPFCELWKPTDGLLYDYPKNLTKTARRSEVSAMRHSGKRVIVGIYLLTFLRRILENVSHPKHGTLMRFLFKRGNGPLNLSSAGHHTTKEKPKC